MLFMLNLLTKIGKCATMEIWGCHVWIFEALIQKIWTGLARSFSCWDFVA